LDGRDWPNAMVARNPVATIYLEALITDNLIDNIR
jgi:hypothetical protein